MIVGIDPGLSGAIAAITNNGTVAVCCLAPVIQIKDKKKVKHEIDIGGFVKVLQGIKDIDAIEHVYLEKVSAMPGQGVTSMFNFGMSYGIVKGILGTLGLSYTLVHPKTWQKEVLKDMPPGSAEAVAVRMFPNTNFLPTARCTKRHDGLIDAVLIAEYGRRVQLGEK